MFNSGMRFSLGLLLLPMAEELEWSRTTLSTMATIYMIIAAAALPFTGRLVDQFGALRVLAVGVLMAGTAVVLTGFVNQPWQAYASYGVLFALGSAATSITPIGVLLARVYPQRIGLANSVAISGMGMGQLLIISVLSTWLVEIGWRGSFLGMGVISVLALLPLLYWCRWVVSIKSGNAAGFSSDESKPPIEKSKSNFVSTKVLLRSQALWLILFIYAICGFQDFLIATHIVAFATDENIKLGAAGNTFALMGLAGLIGVLLTGLLTDRRGPLWPTLICFIIRCVIFAAILISRDFWTIVGVALLYGLTFWITAPLTVVFARRLVGNGQLGAISGLITMIHHGIGGLGAIYGAYLFDRFGDYEYVLVTMLALSVIALILVLQLWCIGVSIKTENGDAPHEVDVS